MLISFFWYLPSSQITPCVKVFFWGFLKEDLFLFSLNNFSNIFIFIYLPRIILHVLGPCERYMTPTLDATLLISSRVGTDLGLSSDSGV